MKSNDNPIIYLSTPFPFIPLFEEKVFNSLRESEKTPSAVTFDSTLY
jgi:hypothetical protein